MYNEKYRPQFHFTAKKNWLNDPNGLVFYDGEYHLFFQHNPESVQWGNMTWGHAVSPDLLRWKQLRNAIEPDELGTIFSGSAVVDWNNSSGFQTGAEKVMVAFYTAAGEHGTAGKRPFTQCAAFSNDRGRTWTKFAGNPVLGNRTPSNRDPRVLWHEPTKKWVLVLAEDPGQYYSFHVSDDLKSWRCVSELRGENIFECPDLFELPVEGRPGDTRWILHGGNGHYLIGAFDGTAFVKESGKFALDHGSNFYAAQTFSDIPPTDGRRIQIPWMNGGEYPDMPFNQQMGFPCELTLRATNEGLRVFRRPVHEIRHIRGRLRRWNDTPLSPGENPLEGLAGDLFEIRAEIDLAGADRVGFRLRGEEVRYVARDKRLKCMGRSVPIGLADGPLKLHLLLDRSSLEVFAQDGFVAMSFCLLPDSDDRSLEIYSKGARAKIVSLEVWELSSVWT